VIGIVIITHGRLSEVLAETATLIMGEQPGLTAVTFSARESLDHLRQKVHDATAPFRESGCLILTDVLGGSATNICAELLTHDWIRILTGVNLPMVMEAVSQRSHLDLVSLARKVHGGGIKGIIDLKDFFAERARRPK
jgi:mannose/fructose/sorbose-specific phosphotransferase system IIA component